MSIHAANADKSTRLQRVLRVLREGGRTGVTSRDLMLRANVVAPGTCVSELRRSGYVIDCDLQTVYSDGARVYAYKLLGRLPR
jgi:hypothetical protein